jgi:hypothetical protein
VRRKRKRRKSYPVDWNVNPSFAALGDAMVEGFKLLSPEEQAKLRQEMLDASRKQAAAAERATFHQRTGVWVN